MVNLHLSVQITRMSDVLETFRDMWHSPCQHQGWCLGLPCMVVQIVYCTEVPGQGLGARSTCQAVSPGTDSIYPEEVPFPKLHKSTMANSSPNNSLFQAGPRINFFKISNEIKYQDTKRQSQSFQYSPSRTEICNIKGVPAIFSLPKRWYFLKGLRSLGPSGIVQAQPSWAQMDSCL